MNTKHRRTLAIVAAVASCLIVTGTRGTVDASTSAVCDQVMAGPCGHADYWPHGFPPPPPASWPIAPR